MDDTNANAASTSGQAGAGTEQILDALSKLQDQQGNFANVLTSLSENVSKLSDSISNQVSNQSTIYGTQDQFDWARRDRLAYDSVQNISLSVLASLAANTDAMLKQNMRITDLAASGHWKVPSAGDGKSNG